MQDSEEEKKTAQGNLCPKCKNEISRDVDECPVCRTILNFDAKPLATRMAELRQSSLGQLLLKEREYLFESIQNSEQLEQKISYCLIYSLLFLIGYGAILGCASGLMPALTMALKVPLVLFGTMLVSLPVLFTFSIFIGGRLSLRQSLTVLLVCNYLTSMTLVSLAPIMLLFIIYSDSISFICILNIVFFIIAGGVGIALLWKAMEYFALKNGYQSSSVLLIIWTAIYSFVGMQFAWSLQVFGDLSKLPLFKQLGIEGNFYLALFRLIKAFFAED